MQVDRVALNEAEFESRYERHRIPVVIQGAIDHWPALGKWSLDHFRRHYGDRRVRCRGQISDITLGEYLDRLPSSTREDPPPYLRNLNIQPDWQELDADISPRLVYSRGDWLNSRLLPKDSR